MLSGYELVRKTYGTAATFASLNPVLPEGVTGVETDTGREKSGDGATAWTSLRYDQPALGSASKMWDALVNQAGTAAPTAIVRQTTLSAALVLARSGVGVYTLTLVAEFVVDKTSILVTLADNATASIVKAGRTSADVITIKTFTDAGVAADLVGDLQVSIIVRP